MSEITPLGGKPRQTLTPDTTAARAPTITAPGAPVVTDPVSPGSRRREAEMRSEYADIKRRYGRHPDVAYRGRRGEFDPRPPPETPVSDVYTITIRGKEEPPGISLDTLVIQQEQRKREDWIHEETVRARILPSQLQHEIAVASYHRQMAAYNKQLQEYNKALEERRKLDDEAKKYGHNTYEELLAAVREEKAIRRLNELGKSLTEAQLISQAVARGSAPPDYRAALEEQRRIAEAAQQSLQKNFGIDVGPKPQEYFQQVTDYTAAIQPPTPTPATTQAGVKGGAWVDPQLGIRITAHPHPDWTATLSKPSKEPLPAGLGLPTPAAPPTPGAGGVVLPWDVSAKREQYDIARAHYERRLSEAEQAGRIRDGVFQVTDPESEAEYLSLIAAGENLAQYGAELEDLQKRELFGIPSYFGEKETALSEFLNLPDLPKEEVRAAAHLSAALPVSPLPPELKELSHGLTYGAYTGIRDRPLTGLASFAVGVLGGAAVKGATALPKLGKFITPTLKGVEAAWVGSIAGRTATTTDWFEAGSTLGNIVTTEAAPVVAGAAAVHRAPGLVARPTGRPGPTAPPPPRQTIVDVVGEVPSPRDIGRVGRTRVIDVAGELPEIRPLGTDPYGVQVFDATGKVPAIRPLGTDPYGVQVFDATGDFGDPAFLGTVDMGVAPPRRLKPRAPGGDGAPLTLYTPEALGARQRAIMADRRHPGIPATPTPPRLISPESPTTTQTQVRPPNLLRPVGLVAIIPPISRTAERQERRTAISFDARTPMGAAPRIDLGIAIEPISATDVIPVSRVDPDLSEISTPTQTPDIEQTPIQTPDLAVDLALQLDQVSIQIPRPVETPRPRRPVRPRPPRPPLLRLEGQAPRRGLPWLEWWVHYAERPTPHARLESAYLGLPDPTPARSRVIRNIQRMTIGTPPAGSSPSPLRTPTVQVGPRLEIAPRRIPGAAPPTRRAKTGHIGILEVF